MYIVCCRVGGVSRTGKTVTVIDDNIVVISGFGGRKVDIDRQKEEKSFL